MLDGLFGRGFGAKCKSDIKTTRLRIEMIMRKRNAIVRFLKKDIADLLQKGLESNAYGRIEEVINELNQLSCYDMIDQFCDYIVKQLPSMQKQRECPPEIREALLSVMYAAARFADLPELYSLRRKFKGRYGNAEEEECFVNQEFLVKIAPKPPSMHKKLQLMKEISEEFSIKWDVNAFEQKLSNPYPSASNQPKKREPLHDGNENGPIHTPHKSRDDASTKQENQQISSRRRQEPSPRGPPELPDMTKKAPTEDAGNTKLHYANNMIPPYVRPKGSKYGTKNSDDLPASYDQNGPRDPSNDEGDFAATNISERTPGLDHIGHEGQVTGPSRSNIHEEEKDHHHCDDNLATDPKPKPRSVRWKHPKPLVQEKEGTTDERRRRGSQQSNATINGDEYNEDDKIVDKLLIRYSTKPSNYETGKPKTGLKAPKQHGFDADNPPQFHDKDSATAHLSSVSGPPPSRAASFPTDQTSPMEEARGPVRATSLQPDILNPNGRHVHPKLPDYDDLAARFAALKGI